MLVMAFTLVDRPCNCRGWGSQVLSAYVGDFWSRNELAAAASIVLWLITLRRDLVGACCCCFMKAFREIARDGGA